MQAHATSMAATATSTRVRAVCAAVHLAGALLIEAEILSSADGALCEAASGRGLHVAAEAGAFPPGATETMRSFRA
jgi:uncharacterized MnhB-related membrane protein